LPRGRPVLRAQRKPRSWPNRVSGTHSVEGTVAYGAGLARHLRGHKVEVIEVDRPNAGSPASPAAACAGAATTVHVTASPLSALVHSAWVRFASVAGRRSWMLALARHCARFRSAYPTDRLWSCSSSTARSSTSGTWCGAGAGLGSQAM